jgi:DNA-binding NtrC family response regulator
VGRSAAMLEVFDLAKKISRHYTNVLISGPTSCGKELVAHALRQMSPVAQARFAVCNWNGKGWNVTAAKLQRDDPWTGGVLKAEE